MAGSSGSVRQVIVGAARHDAITSIALDLAKLMFDSLDGGTYSWFEPDRSVSGDVHHVSHLPPGTEDDVLVYHLSYGIEEMTDWILARPERVVVWYHNVTPHGFYRLVDPDFARGLEHGHEQLGLLRDRCVFAAADSDFNAAEMRAQGYGAVHVAHPNSLVDRFAEVPADPRIIRKFGNRFPSGFVLFVSQVLPHKRPDHAIEVVHLLREQHGLDVGAVWVGPARQPRYFEALEELMGRLGEANVEFAGALSESELAALYRACICFVGVSQHEGLSVPPLEAMANGAPVVVRGAGAVPDTVGDGALVVPPDWGVVHLAEILAEVCRNPALRSRMRVAGRLHLEKTRQRTSFELVAGMVRELVT